MCSAFNIMANLEFLHPALGVRRDVLSALSDALIRPSMMAPIVISDQGKPTLIEARFGLIPHWHKGPIKAFKATTFNARAETAQDKPVFRDAYAERQALIPAESFTEWSGLVGQKQKWQIMRADNQPLVFAGLWDRAMTEEGEVLSFTILTRPAGPDLSAIHDREPVILSEDHWRDWLANKTISMDVPTPLRLTKMT